MSPGGNGALVAEVERKAPSYLGGGSRSRRVLEALAATDRALFLPEEIRNLAYLDDALPIGGGQTCSQPSMVAFMLDELEMATGQKVLEIGAGSGYAAAVASRLCGSEGRIFAVEIRGELAELARRNLGDGYPNLTVLTGDGSAGLPAEAPFDRIFLSAGVAGTGFDERILLDQLAGDGILLFPETRGSVFKIRKVEEGYTVRKFYGVSFVPLVGKNS